MIVYHTKHNMLRERLEAQGYCGYSDKELSWHRHGIRFAYQTCTVCVAVALFTNSIFLLSLSLFVSLLCVILKRHPVDYLYNIVLKIYHKPEIPFRTKQTKFACSVAAFWILVTLLLMSSGWVGTAIIWGSVLVAVGSLVSTTDVCIPSILYNYLFQKT